MADIIRPLFPPAIDSTMVAAFRSCPQKMFRNYVEHWKPQSESVHLRAGGAFAKGIEVARKAFFDGGQSKEMAEALGLEALIKHYGDFQAPEGSAKSLERTAGALEFYYANYPFGFDGLAPLVLADGSHAIEFSFAEPLEIDHPTLKQPLLYTGRADLIGTFAGSLFAVDEKTASSLGASWSRQWELRSQFTGYTWAAQRHGYPVKGALIRGISILKTKYDTQQVPTYRSAWEIERWEKQLHRTVADMLRCWNDGYWDYNLDTSCQDYGGCSLTSICKSKEPEAWLPMSFTKRVWDPLARRELTVEEWEQGWTRDSAEA